MKNPDEVTPLTLEERLNLIKEITKAPSGTPIIPTMLAQRKTLQSERNGLKVELGKLYQEIESREKRVFEIDKELRSIGVQVKPISTEVTLFVLDRKAGDIAFDMLKEVKSNVRIIYDSPKKGQCRVVEDVVKEEGI